MWRHNGTSMIDASLILKRAPSHSKTAAADLISAVASDAPDATLADELKRRGILDGSWADEATRGAPMTLAQLRHDPWEIDRTADAGGRFADITHSVQRDMRGESGCHIRIVFGCDRIGDRDVQRHIALEQQTPARFAEIPRLPVIRLDIWRHIPSCGKAHQRLAAADARDDCPHGSDRACRHQAGGYPDILARDANAAADLNAFQRQSDRIGDQLQ